MILFGSSHNHNGEIQPLRPVWTIHVDRVSLREPAAWIAALRLNDSKQYVLVMLVHPNPRRGIGHETAGQLSELLNLVVRRATRARSHGTQESAEAAVHELTLEAEASQLIAAVRMGRIP